MSHLQHIAVLVLSVLMALQLSAKDQFTLVIDPGHGGHDAGALGQKAKEKDINLSVALAFGQRVERSCPDVKVIYTRKTDVFIPLHDRANIANKAAADLFISVHTNALPAGKIARGFETYTLGMHRAKDNLDVAMRENSVISMEKDYRQAYQGFDPNSSESYIMFEFIQSKNMERSIELAKMIQKSVCDKGLRPNKGVHQAGFLVLRETSMPSCLIELGFITTPDEEQWLTNNNQVGQLADAIFRGFLQYRAKTDQHITIPFEVDESTRRPSLPTIVPEKPQPAPKEQPKRNARPKPQQEPAAPAAAQEQQPKAPAQQDTKKDTGSDKPVFKLQILASDRMLKAGDAHFKGETNVGSYQEGNFTKYTLGESTDYNEIYRLRKDKLSLFPEAFIVAFRNGQKMNTSEAIREFRQQRGR